MAHDNTSPTAEALTHIMGRLKDFKFVLLRGRTKIPIKKEWPKNFHRTNDREFIDHISRGGNYGILCGDGLIVVDADTEEIKQLVREKLPSTFTVETPHGGHHFYYLCDLEVAVRLRDKNDEHLGDIQGPGTQVVGPGSVLPDGSYRVISDLPIARVDEDLLIQTFKDYLAARFEEDAQIESEYIRKMGDWELSIVDVVPVGKLRGRGDEYFGEHPIHGSDTGRNFWVNPTKNCWHCFRHDSGGGPLQWLAVQEGLIDCSEAVPGALKGRKFKEALRIARERGLIREPTFLDKIARQLGTSITGERSMPPTPHEGGPLKTIPQPVNLSLIRGALAEIHRIVNEIAVRHNVGDLIEMAAATYASLALGERDPIWVWLVGPPSSFKTELVKSMKDAKAAYFLRTMTANAFASGAEGSIDLLPILDGRCFVCPDWATVLSGHDETSKKILGDLVSIYDGDYSKHAPARGDIRYKTRMTMIGCVTPSALEKYEEYMSIIGPRLLFYKLPDLGEEEAKKGLEKTWMNNEEKFAWFREKMSEFCDFVLRLAIETKIQPEIPDDLRPDIDRLALFVSHGRGVIYGQWVTFTDEGGRSVTYYEITGVQCEDPYRVHLQFQKLAKALALVHGRAEVTGHEIELLRRIALSSMPSARADVLSAFRQQSTIDGSITSRELAGAVSKSVKTSRRRLQELEMLGIIRSETEESENLGGPGRPPIRYRPAEKFMDTVTAPVTAIDHIADLEGQTDHTSEN